MPITLSFELSDTDLEYFREALDRCRKVVAFAEESEILDAVREVLREIRNNEPLPEFVSGRLPVIESMIEMLVDEEWKLPADDREQILSAFAYFGDPEDILPDDVPVIGYLDDVIVIELVARELTHVREAYIEFCGQRASFDEEKASENAAVRRDRIEKIRQQLHQRMKQRSANSRRSGFF